MLWGCSLRVSPTLLSLMNSFCRCTIVLHTVASADYRSLRCGSRCVGNPLPPWGRHLSSDVTALSSTPACPVNVILPPALVVLITFYHQVSSLGVEAHMTQSALLPSPFKAKPWPEADVCFMVEAVTKWQVYLIPRAAEQRRILRCVAQALVPLEDWLATMRSPSAAVVAASKRPAFCATLAILLRWPDLSLGSSLVEGFPIVGVLANSGVFRHVTPSTAPELQDWLGPAAEEAINRIVQIHSGPPRFHEDILAVIPKMSRRNVFAPLSLLRKSWTTGSVWEHGGLWSDS